MSPPRLWTLSIALVVAGCATRLDRDAVCPMVPDGGSAPRLDMGCTVGAMFQSCAVDPNGIQNCTPACNADEYTLDCFGFSQAPAALACRQIIVHPPAGDSFFCCPCR